jgi:hypothetical protein
MSSRQCKCIKLTGAFTRDLGHHLVASAPLGSIKGGITGGTVVYYVGDAGVLPPGRAW